MAAFHLIIYGRFWVITEEWLGESPAPSIINTEIGNLQEDSLGGKALFRFQRYDMLLESAWLRARLGNSLRDSDLAGLRRIDNPAAMQQLYGTAKEAATEQVQLSHILP